eukprot:170222-Pleurochrysis_carterae.AAC.1
MHARTDSRSNARTHGHPRLFPHPDRAAAPEEARPALADEALRGRQQLSASSGARRAAVA